MANRNIGEGIKEGLLELKRFMKGEDTGAIAKEYGQVDAREIRMKQGLSQNEFAVAFGLNPNTLRNWEHGTRKMDRSAVILLKVIDQYPEAVKKVAKIV
jgi:putative transcriptional regulator